ncbi:TPA: hypothetical protein DCZ32_04875 [Candidatus Uhrbacteria bacterium]|nr:hypothetical protein [Candidatus Uhrbacteria bacterium]
MHSENKNHANYNVGLKVLIKKGNEFLFLTNSKNGYFDLPGGRIDNNEHEKPLSEIIEREVTEELGNEFRYKLGKLIFSFRRHFENKNLHVFLAVYEAEYLSGDIQLSNEHDGYKWMNPKNINLKEENFFSKEEYKAFKTFFKL